MDQEQHSFSQKPISLSFDEFEISVESFKPVTKGLGFHQEQKKSTFVPSYKKVEKLHTSSTLNNISNDLEIRIKKQAPQGLEAFYGTPPAIPQMPGIQGTKEEPKISITRPDEVLREASSLVQFSAWLVDLIVILSLVVVTGLCLILVSGIDYKLFLKLVSKSDLAIFCGSVFSIYYILYFTILDLSATPGKLIFGIRLTNTEQNSFSVKNTFIRSVVSLLSIVAFCFPMLLDFQGRLSDTKLIK